MKLSRPIAPRPSGPPPHNTSPLPLEPPQPTGGTVSDPPEDRQQRTARTDR